MCPHSVNEWGLEAAGTERFGATASYRVEAVTGDAVVLSLSSPPTRGAFYNTKR